MQDFFLITAEIAKQYEYPKHKNHHQKVPYHNCLPTSKRGKGKTQRGPYAMWIRLKLRTGAKARTHNWQHTHGWCVSHHTVVCKLQSVAKSHRKVCEHLHSGEKQVCTHGHPPPVCGCNELIRKGRSWGMQDKTDFPWNFNPLTFDLHWNNVFWLWNQSA